MKKCHVCNSTVVNLVEGKELLYIALNSLALLFAPILGSFKH